MESPKARPFLKWAGGKTKLLKRVPKQYGTYYEPFLGGGALFFALQPKRAVLSDLNRELITTYRAVRNNPTKVANLLEGPPNNKDYYYFMRAYEPITASGIAARMIYLNKCGFRGLYRLNKKGGFNVPFGNYKKPKICDRESLGLASEALNGGDKGVYLWHGAATTIAEGAREGDFVYFDPPYHGTFNGYNQTPFDDTAQWALSHLFGTLAKRGVHVLLSNSDTPLIRKLYQGHKIETITTRRCIGAGLEGSTQKTELLISGGT